MQIIYWAHSYRDEDAPINRHFGTLIEQSERMIVNFDPPSQSVNEAKLDQNLRACDGMVAVLSWRASGPSQYILQEIALAMRARKPLLVFVDERISGNILPPRILQRRFSHRTYFRQYRDHTHALRSLKSYIGEAPPTKYQPGFSQRSCGLIGLGSLSPPGRKTVFHFLEHRGFGAVDLEQIDWISPRSFERSEHLANLDVVVRFIDRPSRRSYYWIGAANAAAIPTISITTDPDFEFAADFPREFQAKQAEVVSGSSLQEVLGQEFDLYEQEFLKAADADAIERYTKMQVEARSLDGKYEVDTRRQFLEVIMGDKYDVSGQAGAVGPHAHAHDINFTQTWNRVEDKVDLDQLAIDLKKLRAALDGESAEPAQKLAAGAVAAAEQSALQKDGPKTLEYLKTAGTWALKVAEKIGVEVASKALKAALGIPG